MTEFGGFANINPDKMLREAQQRVAKMSGMQERIAQIVGEAESSDGYVKATYTATGGLKDLELNPRAMRMASTDLASTIKEVIRAAMEDFQQRMRLEMSSAFEGQDDNPLELAQNPEKIKAKVEEATSMLDGALNDVLGQMERIKKQMGM